MSEGYTQTLVDAALAQQVTSDAAAQGIQRSEDDAFALSVQSAVPLARFLQQMCRQSSRQLEITKERQGSALFFYTNLLLPVMNERGVHVVPSLFFAVRGNEVYSNLRNPLASPAQVFAPARPPERRSNKLVGLSQVQLFGLIRQLATGQGMLNGQTADEQDSFKQAVANARPVLAGLRSLRHHAQGQLGFSLKRMHNALSIQTNLYVDIPYDESGTAPREISLTVQANNLYAHNLQQARGKSGAEPISAHDFLSEVAKLAVSRRWIVRKANPQAC